MFENGTTGGTFQTNADGTAHLYGEVAAANGKTFFLDLYLDKLEDPSLPSMIKYPVGGKQARTSDVGDPWLDWDYYTLNTAFESILYGLSDDLHNYKISLHMAPMLAVQVGVGANDKDTGLNGLSTWIDFESCGPVASADRTLDQAKAALDTGSCSGSLQKGDINIVLEPVPLPASALLLLAGVGGLGLSSRRRKT